MRSITVIFTICLAALTTAVQAQPPELLWDLWDHTYGGNSTEWNWCLIQTPDGNFAISGNTSSFGAGWEDLWLLRVDEDGELLEDWPRTYGGQWREAGCDVVWTTDGGFALGGMTFSYGPNIPNAPNFWMVKTEQDGRMSWSRYYGSERWDHYYGYVVPFIQTADRGFAIGGLRQVQYEQGISWDAVIILTDEEGQNQREFGFGTGESIDAFQEFVETDEGILCLGHTDSREINNWDPWLVMVNPENGEEVWSNIIEIEEEQMSHRAIKTSDGGYAMVGAFIQVRGNYFHEGNDAFFIRMDEEGELLWYKRWGGDQCELLTTLVELHNGAFAIVGLTASFGEGEEDGWLLLTDDVGDSLSFMTFGGEARDLFDGIVETDDHELYISGSTHPNGNDNQDFWLLRLSPPEFSFIEGHAIDAADSSAIESVVITSQSNRSTITDTTGFYRLTYIWADDTVLTASILGYNDLILNDLELAVDETLEVNFELTHPEMVVSIDGFNEELQPGHIAVRTFSISDSGNGVLEWSAERRLLGESGVDPGVIRESFNAGELVEDSRLAGVVYIDEQYYVTGGGNDTNRVYVLDGNGEPVRSFPQFGDSRYGMKDLAWDGELIWGVADETVYGFNTDGDSVTSFQADFDRLSATHGTVIVSCCGSARRLQIFMAMTAKPIITKNMNFPDMTYASMV